MSITIRAINDANLPAVLALSVAPGQRRHIETTAECLAEADADARWCPVALCHGDTLVGFAMYGAFPGWTGTDRSRQVWLDRLLIDQWYQGRGYGEAALIALLGRLEKVYATDDIYLSVYGDNAPAIALYERHGFAFNGELDSKGEKVMVRHHAAAVPLGMPTLLQCPTLAENAALAARLGLSFVELNMNLPAYQVPFADESAIRAAWDAYGVYCTLHLDENFAPCDFNPRIREAYLQTAQDAIGLAARHGMPVINMHLHPGVHFKLPGGKVYLYGEYMQHYLDSLLALRDRCGDMAGQAGILLCIENTDGFAPYAQEGIDLLLAHPAFALTLDIGHDHCAGGADAALYAAHSSRLAHMHIHDANDATCHLPLGTGTLAVADAIKQAKATHCRAVVEVKNVEGLEKSIAALRTFL